MDIFQVASERKIVKKMDGNSGGTYVYGKYREYPPPPPGWSDWGLASAIPLNIVPALTLL